MNGSFVIHILKKVFIKQYIALFMYISNSIHLIVKESITYALPYMYYVVLHSLQNIIIHSIPKRELANFIC